MKDYIVVLTFSCDKAAVQREIKQYIESELRSSGGCRHPEDPLFDSLSDVKVRTIFTR